MRVSHFNLVDGASLIILADSEALLIREYGDRSVAAQANCLGDSVSSEDIQEGDKDRFCKGRCLEIAWTDREQFCVSKNSKIKQGNHRERKHGVESVILARCGSELVVEWSHLVLLGNSI